jgi:hypothetical protein
MAENTKETLREMTDTAKVLCPSSVSTEAALGSLVVSTLLSTMEDGMKTIKMEKEPILS